MTRRSSSSAASLSPSDLVKGSPLIIIMILVAISQTIMIWLIQHPTIHHKPVERHLQPKTNSSVLIIAAVPRNEMHMAALWTIMECFTFGFDMVLISSSREAEPIMEIVVEKMNQNELHPNIQTLYSANDRYDVGLWCDALEYLSLDQHKYYVLLNDSVFALRRFRAILDYLHSDRYHLVGLSYSHLGSYWIESFFRGFSLDGVQRFRQHSCLVPPMDATYATKRSIVDHHEIALTNFFEPSERIGLFSADPPELYPDDRGWSNKTWVSFQNIAYWREIMVNIQRFPVAKVKIPMMAKNVTSPLIQLCMEKVDPIFFIDLFAESDNETVIGT
jgi:hypothetical protein